MDGLKAALRESRSGGDKVLCVATQVVEAGVDFSFERVIRLTAGLDSIIQAAGRQNREGESSTPCPMSIVTCSDESLSGLKDIEHAKASTENVLYEFSRNSGAFGDDLSSDASIKAFYHEYFNEGISRNSLDYPIDLPDLKTSILSLLSCNEGLREEGSHCYVLNQAFKTAGNLFKVFDDDTVDVVVPYGKEGEKLIAEFGSEGIGLDFEKQRNLVRKAKSFCVSLRHHQVVELLEKGAIVPKCDGLVVVLQPVTMTRIVGLRPNQRAWVGWRCKYVQTRTSEHSGNLRYQGITHCSQIRSCELVEKRVRTRFQRTKRLREFLPRYTGSQHSFGTSMLFVS